MDLPLADLYALLKQYYNGVKVIKARNSQPVAASSEHNYDEYRKHVS